MRHEKPYFCPLMKVYFLKIQSGEQSCEIRPVRRGWNQNNIYPGREITFSNGYGKNGRVTKRIRKTEKTKCLSSIGIEQWHIDAVLKIYGSSSDTEWLVAHIDDQQHQLQTGVNPNHG